MDSLFENQSLFNGAPCEERSNDDVIPLSHYLDADLINALHWADHGAVDRPYVTHDEAERIEADSIWAKQKNDVN